MLISLQVIAMMAVMILLVKTKSKEDNLQACIFSRFSVQPLGGGSLGPKAEAGEQI